MYWQKVTISMKVICGLAVEMTEYSDSSSSNHIPRTPPEQVRRATVPNRHVTNSDKSDIGGQNQSDHDIENDLDISGGSYRKW
jgi:hypothetical protein